MATGAVIGTAVGSYYASPYYNGGYAYTGGYVAQPYVAAPYTYACGGYAGCAPAEGYAYPTPYPADPDPNGY